VRSLLIVLLTVVAVWWLYYGLFGRSISTDGGISVLAAAGIREHGYPLLPSGEVYNRAYLAHYIVALSTLVFGEGDFGIMFPSFAAALATLWLTYRLGRDLLGSPVIGLVAVGLMALSATQTFYATSPRMYQLMAFFATWAVLAAYRGFVANERHQRWQSLLALALGLQCERGAGTLIGAIGLALLLVNIPRGEATRWTDALKRIGVWMRTQIRSFSVGEWLAASCLLVSIALVLHDWNFGVTPIVHEGGRPPNFIGFNGSPIHLAWQLLQFDAMVAGTLWLTLLGLLVAWQRWRMQLTGPPFVALVWIAATLQVALLMRLYAPRFFYFLLPLYTVLAALGLVTLGRAIIGARHRSRHRAIYWGAILALMAYTGGVLAAKKTVSRRFRETYRAPYLLPNRTREGHLETKQELLALQAKLGPSDLVLTSNPWVTDYYLGRTDGLLRQRVLRSRRFGTFPEPRDEYFGTLIYDSPAELDALLAHLRPGQHVWLVTERKFKVFSSRGYKKYVEHTFARANQSSRVRIYRSRPSF